MGRRVRIDMTGERYGRLVAIDWDHRDSSGHAHWRFACDCGGETVAHGGNVRAGRTTSCGCVHREMSAARLTVHGARASRRHPATYRAWQQMNAEERTDRRGCAGASDSVVPASWRADYTVFLADMGERPAGTKLVRADAARGFSADNCRWAPVADRGARAGMGWRGRRERAANAAAALLDRARAAQRAGAPA